MQDEIGRLLNKQKLETVSALFRKQDPKTGKRDNLGTFDTKKARNSTSAPCNTSKRTEKNSRVSPDD